MPKTPSQLLGICYDHGRLSLTLVKDKRPVKAVWRDVPEEVRSKDGVFSQNLYAEFIKDTMKENGISAKEAAYVVPGGDLIIRTVSLPKMGVDQLKLNLPFEFRDYIKGEMKDYIFDYAYLPPIEPPAEGEESSSMDLFAVAMPREQLAFIRQVTKQAGLKLVMAAPDVTVFEKLLGLLPEEERMKERCILDIGQNASRMFIYKNLRYKLVHSVEIGERHIVQAVADEMNVDMHIAKAYLESNYEHCMDLPAVQNSYKDISLEVLKGLNFYEMADMSARLKDVALSGGGAQIEPLVALLKERISMNVLTLNELFSQYNNDGFFNITAPSYAVAV